jgi:C4-dicarboxylate transporter DctM subunit
MNGPLVMALLFVCCLAIGVPVPFAAGLATICGLLIADIPLVLLAQSAFTAFEPFPLTTIPMFILAGQLMEKGGMSERLIEIAKRLVGAYRGGLGLVTVVASMFFAALSGSGPATTAAVGSVTIPAMIKEEYSARFGGALAAAGGAIGSIIPPSNLLIIYALVSDTSIPRLFLAGIVPGIIVGLLLLVTAYVIARHKGFGEKTQPFTWAPLLRAAWDGKWAIGAPVIVLGGIYAGIFTPSEAAGIAVFYGLFIGLFVYRGLTLGKIMESARFTAITIGTVLIILGTTKAFGQLVTVFDIPSDMAALFAPIMEHAWLVLICIAIFYVLVGMWLESIPQIIIFTAVFLPIAQQLGVDPVLFGIITVMTCEIGFLTPPIGVNLFVASKIANVTLEDISAAALPLLVPYVIVLLMMIMIPEWVTFLPDLRYGG